MTSVIIPSNRSDCLSACLAALDRREPLLEAHRVIPVLDGIDPPAGYDSWIRTRKPFCFAKAVNAGIKEAGSDDIILLNHDAVLETSGGLSALIAGCLYYDGLVSAGIYGDSCNPAQDQELWNGKVLFEPTDKTVAFAAVYIPRRTIDRIGLLDERLTGYGYDDDLYCDQVRAAGLRIGVFHGCVFEHRSLPSSYRTDPRCGEWMRANHKTYHRIVEEQNLRAHSTHMDWCRESFD